MSAIAQQASFNSGEWAPQLFARVDLAKYHSAAALLENFFVDYRGGASTRPGSKYIIRAYDSANPVILIPFQANTNTGYMIEVGNGYMRFIYNGAIVTENPFAISGATKANPCVITVVSNNFIAGDWIYIAGVGGMTQLNGRYFKVLNVVGNAVTLGDLNGNNLDSTGYTTYTSGGTSARIYKISSPYTGTEVTGVKFAQSVNQMVLCHPNHAPYVLTLISATNWSLLPVTIGTTSTAPTGLAVTTSLGSGNTSYSYTVTTIDANGQESSPATAASLLSKQDIRAVNGSNKITWTAVSGAVQYYVYESEVSYFGVTPNGVTYGYIGYCYGNTFIDSNISPDYSKTPPIANNPFIGAGVSQVNVTAPGTYTSVPTVTFTGAASTITASAAAVLQVQGTPTIGAGGSGYVAGDTVLFTNNVILVVGTVDGSGAVLTWQAITTTYSNPGSVTSGSTPANPVVQVSTSGIGTGATANLTWGVGQVQVLNVGAGYTSTPTVTFSAGAAAATAVLSATSNGYPTVPSFFQQRMILAAPSGAPQTFYASQSGAYYNFNTSQIAKASDAITGTLVSGQLNTIKSIVSSAAGMLMFTDKAVWLVNGGTSGSAITPSATVANTQSFVGASDVPPIVANFDVLFVQQKGSAVYDLSYNIYFNIFTGTDISISASHLFFGKSLVSWAWAQEPFKVVWAVRNDGVMLTLTYLKEQEFVGWAHQVTNGSYLWAAAVTEPISASNKVDAVYAVVQRTVGGSALKYIERNAERSFPNGVASAWCVDSGLQYSGSPTTTFVGAEHLAGLTVTGLADGVIIPPFTMPANGQFTLSAPASVVTIGEGFTCKLQTMPLDLQSELIQGKVKKINYVDIRVVDTLGLSIGPDFDHLVPMKDLVIGNVSSTLTGQQSQIITGLVVGDARTFLSPTYTVPGQYCLQQSNPLPASILGVFPSITMGDSDGRRN